MVLLLLKFFFLDLIDFFKYFRCQDLDFSALDELLQEQGSQPTSGHAEEAAVDVHVVLQREAGTNSFRKPFANDAGSG